MNPKTATQETAKQPVKNSQNGVHANGNGKEPVNALARAVVLHMNGDLQGALKTLESAEQDGGLNAEILAARGYVQMDLGDYEGAAKSYAGLAGVQANDAEAWFQWGYCLQKLSRPAEALEKFQHSVKLGSTWIETPLAIGICHLSLKQYKEAITALDECLAKDAKYRPAIYTKAVALHLTWTFDEAVKLYEQVLESEPTSEETLLNLISLGLQQKNLALLEKYSKRLLEIKPDAPEGLEGLAVSAFARGEFDVAAGHYKRLTELIPAEVEYWLNLGISHHRQSKLQEAVPAFTKARELRSDSTYVQTYLGFALWQTGDLAGARTCFQTALSQSPERDDIVLHLASVMEEQKAEPEAAQVCVLFLETKPDVPEVWFRLGYLRLYLQEFSGAIEAFDKCLQLNPGWPEAELNLALACFQGKQASRAQKVLESMLSREPDNAEVTKGLATIALESGDNNRAFTLHMRLIELGAATPEIYYNCGLLAQQAGNAKKAAEFYGKALEQRRDFPEALLNLGHVLNSEGREDEARACWAPALELKPELALGYFRKG